MRQGTFRAIVAVFGVWNTALIPTVVALIPTYDPGQQLVVLIYAAGTLALTVACILLYKHPSSRRGFMILCGSLARGAMALP